MLPSKSEAGCQRPASRSGRGRKVHIGAQPPVNSLLVKDRSLLRPQYSTRNPDCQYPVFARGGIEIKAAQAFEGPGLLFEATATASSAKANPLKRPVSRLGMDTGWR
jgi:hypothetical protein